MEMFSPVGRYTTGRTTAITPPSLRGIIYTPSYIGAPHSIPSYFGYKYKLMSHMILQEV